MTIVHVDTANAAAASDPSSELTLPVTFEAVGASSPWSASAVLVIYGDTNDVLEGDYFVDESLIGDYTGTWLPDTSETGKWLVRLVNTVEFGGPTSDLFLYYNSGVWLSGQSPWKALGSSWGWSGVSVDTQITFACGWSYGLSGEYIAGTIEFAKGATGLLETFTDANVSTGTDNITITGHGFSQGDGVLFTDGGGTPPSPLVNNTVYYVIDVDANTIKLGANMAAVDVTPSQINITTTGSGTFSLRRIEADGTAGIFVEAVD